jgi:dolichyl-phosphate-mannose--protein O-mannosyl transferase
LGDELDVAKDAFDYMQRGHFGLVMWQHPKLRNILEYFTLQTFGSNIVGLRFVSVSLGTLTIPALGLVARKVTKSDAAALLCAFFLTIDCVHIDLSRQAVHEIYMPFFTLVALYMALHYLDAKNSMWLIASGVFFGLGLASKWYVALPQFVTILMLAYGCVKEAGMNFAEKGKEILFYCSALIFIPITVYILTYLPWMLHRGYGLGEWLDTQRIMYAENLVHQGFNPILVEILDKQPLLWFIRPVAFVDFVFGKGEPIILLGMTNPFVWLLTLPAVCYLMYRVVKIRNWNDIFLVSLFWCSYLPFALAQNRLIAVNSALAVAPFAFVIVAFIVVTLLKDKPYRTIAASLYVFLILLTAYPLYTMAIGRGYGTFVQPVIERYRPLNER